jgi:hypothetical protein
VAARRRDKVLVPTQTGPEVAECVWAPQWIDDDIEGLPVCEGFATASDLARAESVRAKRAGAKLLARRLYARWCARRQRGPVDSLRCRCYTARRLSSVGRAVHS